MDFEFDPEKDAANQDKHGVPLAFASNIFDDPNLVIVDASRIEDGEERLKAVGQVDNRIWTVIYTLRGEMFRLISVRKSNASEKRWYGQIHL